MPLQEGVEFFEAREPWRHDEADFIGAGTEGDRGSVANVPIDPVGNGLDVAQDFYVE